MTLLGSESKRREAFTLIEVLLVLVILVVLASLGTTSYLSMQRQANVDAARAQSRLFEPPLQLYHMHVGNWPPNLEALVEAPPDAQGAWKGPYMDQLPLDPWRQPYQYQYPGQHNGELKPDVFAIDPEGREIGNFD